jgi:Zn2+/Cd2+-exporting ATPase
VSRPKKMLPVIQPVAGSPSVRQKAVRSAPVNGAERTVVRVEGMDCASCATTVEKSVSRVPGVRKATVNFAAGRLDAEHDKGIALEQIEQAVRNAGFGVGRAERADRAPFWHTPRALSVLASTLLFALGLVLGFAGAPEVARVSAYVAAIVVGGWPIFRAALAGVRTRHLDMNVLMSAATIGGAAIGEWAEAASVVVLFAAGNALQVYAIDRTRGAVRVLARLAPDEVLVKRGSAEHPVPVDAVAVGETVIVRPGERVALDGEVIEGHTAVDESPVTGESTPAEKGPGDRVFSGSLNGQGALLVKVTKSAEDSTLQRIVRMVEEAQTKKAPTEQFVDRFSRVYTPLVVAVAVTLAVVPPLLGEDFGTWFYRALALLIIACPCALVISTPVTVVSGIGAASRRGILVKGGAALEAAGRLKALAFDKTGTLTEGRPVLSRVVALDGCDEAEALALAAALERRSEHPLAHAILVAGTEQAAGGDGLPPVENFRAVAGRGAEGEVGGRRYLIGSPRLFEERGMPLDGAGAALAQVEREGETPVILGNEHTPLAVFGLADAVRAEARATLDALRDAGVEELVMLTGDAEAPARRVAGTLDIGHKAQLLPEQKVEAVRELVARKGTAGMVGDGVNDAPALAASSVGFAMGAAGTDVALETADVALMQDDLPKLAEAVKLSHSAEQVIKQNVFVSILIKGLFVLLAPFGLVALWLAVLADMGTSIAVTLNGLRLFRQGRA